MIQFKDVSFVIQGAITSDSTTFNVIESIKGNFPGSKIILSTWEGTLVNNLNYDKLILSKDPGGIIVDDSTSLYNNVNRQIVSSIEGIKKVDTKYVIKTRTDIIFNSARILNYLSKYNKVSGKYNITKSRILVLSDTTYNPHRKYKMPYHICDFIYAGLTEDIYNVFNIDLMPVEYFRWYENYVMPINSNYPTILSRYMPETYIWYSFLKKNIFLDFKHSYDIDNNNIELSESIIGDILIIVSSFQVNVKCLKYPNQFFASFQKYSYYEWKKLFNKNKLKNFSFFDFEFLFLFTISKIKNVIKKIWKVK